MSKYDGNSVANHSVVLFCWMSDYIYIQLQIHCILEIRLHKYRSALCCHPTLQQQGQTGYEQREQTRSRREHIDVFICWQTNVFVFSNLLYLFLPACKYLHYNASEMNKLERHRQAVGGTRNDQEKQLWLELWQTIIWICMLRSIVFVLVFEFELWCNELIKMRDCG